MLAARYALTGEGRLELRLTMTTDAATWVNIANHSLWNLDGGDDLTGHRLRILADRYTPADDTALVTGEIATVADTPHDFRRTRAIGPGTEPAFDHNFCLSDARRAPVEVAERTGASGVTLRLSTSEPGLQVYDAATCDTDGCRDHHGGVIGAYCGLALEPQGWPDAPNQPDFPSVVLPAGTVWEQITRGPRYRPTKDRPRFNEAAPRRARKDSRRRRSPGAPWSLQ